MSVLHYEEGAWYYRNHAGDMHPCPPPFGAPQDAVRYALVRLLDHDAAEITRMIDAKAALEWALKQDTA